MRRDGHGRFRVYLPTGSGLVWKCIQWLFFSFDCSFRATAWAEIQNVINSSRDHACKIYVTDRLVLLSATLMARRREIIEQYELLPQPNMQNPRLRTEVALGSRLQRFHLGSLEVPLVYEDGQRGARTGRTRTLARVSLKESNIDGAGYGVHLLEDVAAKQLLLMYWGEKISGGATRYQKVSVIFVRVIL
jgi:hypothetical protein